MSLESAEITPTPVRVGVPFPIPPSIDTSPTGLALPEQTALLDIIGVGPGKLLFTHPSAEQFLEDFDGVSTPAGPFNVEFEAHSSILAPKLTTLPIEISIYLNNLSQEQVDRYTAVMMLNARTLKGVSDYDAVELNRTGRSYMFFLSWAGDTEETMPSQSYFPQKPTVFAKENMQFVILEA